ncbi:YbjN domain-containing protein [Cellulomonas sp. SLBN-39]|uniref:YbjN domain-containing protein n=1 Tax=Cellulomonas sp. SLBN-39 TaxID=2768446 RepID=UPI001152DC0A|nr:YbjN domain-containing protein [Cellulomonas sp. SLBN-39]TQL02374.1 putative sensory transduction regulator [Cellulomonas sp. SLBN-39]
MGFFNKPTATPGSALPPLSAERITACLDAREMRYGIDDDGDVGGYWDGHLFYFFRIGQDQEYLQVRGRWNRQVGLDELATVSAKVNDWNADRLWPKVYVRVEDDRLGVYAEHTVDYEHGLTDEQLDVHLACGISTALSFFEALDEAYPEQAAAAKAAEAEQE